MNVAKQTLQQTLGAPNRYTIPLFQRHYSWGKDNWEKLWEDIEELHDSSSGQLTHFMGALVFVSENLPPSLLPAFQVIDGQQRLTTLSILLCSLRNKALALGDQELAEQIAETYLIHKYKKGNERFRVYPRHRDRVDYQNVVEGIPTSEGGVSAAVKFFGKKLEDHPSTQSTTGLRNLFELMVARLEFVHITLDGESPYRIFSSLNSTGVDLTEADLIRNFMFMHVPTAKQEEFDREQWEPLERRFEFTHTKKDGTEEKKLDGKAISAFHRDFLMRGGKYIGPATTFDTFVGRYEMSGFDPELLTLEMEEAVGLYDTIRRQKKHPSLAVDAALQQFYNVDTSTAFPLVLNLLERYRQTTLSEGELVECLRLLSGFVFRRYVCGETSRPYGRWFVSACGELKSAPVPNLRAFLVSKHFPDDATFKARFQTFDLYNSGYPKAVLRWLELSHPDHPTKEPVDLSFKHIQIEHVMPQTLSAWWEGLLGSDAVSIHRKWLHTPGNLTLTGYNQEFSNRPFPEKCHGWTTASGSVGVGYDKSNIALTKEIAQEVDWKETQIQARAVRLADLAVTIWPAA